MSLHIETTNGAELEQLILFNQSMYPNKVIGAKDILDFWFSKSENENGIYLLEDDGSVHGQMLTSSMSYYYKGFKHDTVWLFDLIVDEALRADAWGIDVILASMDKHPASCSTGAGPEALKLHLKLGNKMLGEIRKYLGITNPLWLATSVFRGKVPVSTFPNEVKVKGHSFVKIDKQNLPELTSPYNENLWEVARDKEFLQWRYFNNLHNYAFYKDTQSNDYFVVRTIIQSHVTAMLLVDYRCVVSTPEAFERIYAAVSKVMSKVHLGILITGSSLATIDLVLEAHHFKSMGRPRPVIGFQKVKDRKADIEARDFAFVTLADSDGDINWV